MDADSFRASIDMTDSDEDNSPLTSTTDNDIIISTLNATQTTPNLVSDWSSADSTDGGWTDQEFDDDNDDNDSDSDDPAEQEQFDRISGILSQLIQEANNAINSTSAIPGHQVSTQMAPEEDDGDMEGGDNLGLSISTINDVFLQDTDDFGNMDETPLLSTSPLPIHPTSYEPYANSTSMMERAASTSTTTEPRRRSRIPRPKKLTLETQHHHYSYHNRSSSNMSASSSSSSNMDYDDDTLFSPISPSSLTTPMSRTISPLLFEKGLYTQLSRQGSAINDEADLAILCSRAVQNHHQRYQRDDDDDDDDDDDSETTEQEYTTHHFQGSEPLMSPNGSLMASFERLDSSLAIVDSLSRDLANYRRQHPRQHNNNNNNSSDIHPMTSTSLGSIVTGTSLDTLPSTHPAMKTTTTTAAAPSMTTIPSDDDKNIYTYQQQQQQQHYNRQSSGDKKWMMILIVGPILYIPYLLMASLWDQLIESTSTKETPFSLFLSTTSATVFDNQHTFASLKNALITTITSTAAISNGGGDGNGMVPHCAGLAVFLLFLAILHLLKGDCATIDQDIGSNGRQFIKTYTYNDQSKMIRRSSLPMMPCSPSLSRRKSF